MRQRTSAGWIGTAILLVGLVAALAGCGGGSSSSGAEGTTTTDTTATTELTSTDTTSGTDTTTTGTVVNAGETATWRGDAFTVSDVETSDTAPVPDILGETPEAENGVWLSFKITIPEENSGPWGFEFVENMHIRGGDGAIYDDLDNNGAEQDFNGEDNFLVWVDIPEAAVSGAVFEIYDGLHELDPDPSDPYVEPVPDPAYATRVNLGV